MKKIIHFLPSCQFNSIEKMILSMCKNINEYHIIVLCGNEKTSKAFKDNNIKSYNINFYSSNKLNLIKEVRNILKEEDIDIIHAHNNLASTIAYLANRKIKKDIKIVSQIHEYSISEDKGINKALNSLVKPKYDFNIVSGKNVFDYYNKNNKRFEQGKTEILLNAIDLDSINIIKEEESSMLKEQNKIRPDHKVFGFIGSLDNEIITFMKVLAKNKRKFENCKFLFIGESSIDEEIKKIIKLSTLEELVTLTGHQDDISKYYSIIDVLFVPSSCEELPISLLEAMAFKKAVVSMDIGSIGEVINDKNGILIEKGNYKKFIDSLITLKEDEELLEEYGQNSFQSIMKNYNLKNYTETITKTYAKLA